MLGISISLTASIILAIAVIVLKRSYKELNPSVAYLWDSLFGLLIWIPIGIVFGGKFEEIKQCIGYAIISAVLSEALVFYALSKGNLSITSVLIATYPIYTVLFSFLINKEILTMWQLTAVVVTILGTIFVCIEKNIKETKILKSIMALGGVVIPLFTAVAIGIADTLSKRVIDKTSAYSFLIALAIVQVPVAVIYFKLSKQKFRNTFKEMKTNIKDYKDSIAGSLFNIIGTGCLMISFNYTLASIASPITRRI